MTTVNIARSPFLSSALDYIAANPGCSKTDVINALGRGRKIPSKTRAGQSSRIGDLVKSGLVENRGNAGKCQLFASKEMKTYECSYAGNAIMVVADDADGAKLHAHDQLSELSGGRGFLDLDDIEVDELVGKIMDDIKAAACNTK